MRERLKIALKQGKLSNQMIAERLGIKVDTFRKAVLKDTLNDGYLILIQQEFGISKEWLRNGKEPVFISKEDVLKEKIEDDVFAILDQIDPEKIVAYQLLKENKFTALPSFVKLVEKVKISKRISDIVNKEKL
ncbi:hypothetical protein H2O64_04515 [Kordia sp. YSTF-M3]|uniref:HTH cro/C1-type domain-containing protein n=1 Tax=Kordia aestuariivivens TaxID=2759037 RepID=A0ABR7Q6E4_9FLAO|nr:hypothetical protein [Kordia aestuariivivens]MBC8753921.1 hypothetical protein [Kordia aestuariivivens]